MLVAPCLQVNCLSEEHYRCICILSYIYIKSSNSEEVMLGVPCLPVNCMSEERLRSANINKEFLKISFKNIFWK